MLEIKSRSKVPSGGAWKYKTPETGFVISHPYLHILESLAKKHRLANNYPIGGNWTQEFELNVCANHPETCAQSEPSLLTKAQSLAVALGKFAMSGFQVASNEVVAARLEICESCEFFERGRKILRGKCSKCGCTTATKLAMSSESCPLGKWNAA